MLSMVNKSRADDEHADKSKEEQESNNKQVMGYNELISPKPAYFYDLESIKKAKDVMAACAKINQERMRDRQKLEEDSKEKDNLPKDDPKNLAYKTR